MLEAGLPELLHIEDLIVKFGDLAEVEVIQRVEVDGHSLPLYGISLGSKDLSAPVFGVIGGVHGLERVGTQLVVAYMRTVSRLLSWDKFLQSFLEQARLVFVPLVNPGGMLLRKRSNPNHVDLMRNAPIDIEFPNRLNLVSGHRISPKLPWYRGEAGHPMESEAIGLCRFIQNNFFQSEFAMSIDLHSGFGMRDRIWFPFARTTKPFPNISEMYSLSKIFRKAYPNHVYLIEPQSQSYTTNGDLWDYLYLEHKKRSENNIYLPLTLEMGSWSWVKKNPIQILSALGVFNPIKPHREKRTLRRHLPFLDFLLRATLSHENWAWPKESQYKHYRKKALHLWYTS